MSKFGKDWNFFYPPARNCQNIVDSKEIKMRPLRSVRPCGFLELLRVDSEIAYTQTVSLEYNGFLTVNQLAPHNLSKRPGRSKHRSIESTRFSGNFLKHFVCWMNRDNA